MKAALWALLSVLAASPASAALFELVRSNAECGSSDDDLGMQPNVDACAARCLETAGCLYFIFGKGFKQGRCFWEHTATAACTENFEVDEYDFFQITCPPGGVTPGGDTCVQGCMEPRASNFNPSAMENDGSCIGELGCAETVDSPPRCTSCLVEKATGTCADGAYRSRLYDEVLASRVPDAALVMDGDLRDWSQYVAAATTSARSAGNPRWYVDVPFAKENDEHIPGPEVVFETHQGGKYFGPSDFSMGWMLAWDSTYFYLAVEVTDDVLQTSDQCFKNGLQAAFEVGGPQAQGGQGAGKLQAERSSSLDVSRLELINLSLKGGQTACTTMGGVDAGTCCLDYELSQQTTGFFGKEKVAILRNPMKRSTTYEVAFHKDDLLGQGGSWNDGLRFGFSFVINDGDDVAEQNGWGGYYPYAIVKAWYPPNNGQKQPQKVGTVRFASADAPRAASGGAGGGDAGKSFGFTILGGILGCGILIGVVHYKRGQSPGASGVVLRSGAIRSSSSTQPMASFDQAATPSSFSPPPLVLGGAMAPPSNMSNC